MKLQNRVDNVFEGKMEAWKLKRGDIFNSPKGPFYVHRVGHNRRGATTVSGCYEEDLKTIEDKFSEITWTFRDRYASFDKTGTVSTQLQNRFQRAEDKYHEEKSKREQQQFAAIDPKWTKADDTRRGGQMTIKAKDGKYYKAGDVVDVAWSDGTAPALLGNLDGRLYNEAGEVAVMSVQGIRYGRAKARFLAPSYIVGAARNAASYNAAELLQQARGSKDKMAVRKAQRQSFKKGLWGF